MGVTDSRPEEVQLDYQRNWVDPDLVEKGKIPYTKNVNRYGDSDYDDELDPVDVLEFYEAEEKRPDHKGDGKGFYDDKIDDSDADNENLKLLDKSKPNVPKMELSALDKKSETQKTFGEKKTSITSVRTGQTARTAKFRDTRDPRR